MPKCDISIQLDRNVTTVRPGDEIAGTVHIAADGAMECRRTALALEWRTHGRGNRASGIAQEVELTGATGRLEAGTVIEAPFRVQVPAGPYTYHGHYLNVDWYLRAWADVPHARDPKGERELILVPDDRALSRQDETRNPSAPNAATPEQARRGKPIATGCMIAFALPFLLVGLGVMGASLASMKSGSGWGAFGVVFGGVFAAVACAMIYFAVRNRMAERRLGAVDVRVDPAVARPGDTVRCVISFTPTAAATLDDVRLVLSAKEIVVAGSGTRRTTYTHELHKQDVGASGPRQLAAGSRFEYEASVRLPKEAPFSFKATDNELRWAVDAHISIPKWPDWKGQVLLTVRP